MERKSSRYFYALVVNVGPVMKRCLGLIVLIGLVAGCGGVKSDKGISESVTKNCTDSVSESKSNIDESETGHEDSLIIDYEKLVSIMWAEDAEIIRVDGEWRCGIAYLPVDSCHRYLLDSCVIMRQSGRYKGMTATASIYWLYPHHVKSTQFSYVVSSYKLGDKVYSMIRTNYGSLCIVDEPSLINLYKFPHYFNYQSTGLSCLDFMVGLPDTVGDLGTIIFSKGPNPDMPEESAWKCTLNKVYGKKGVTLTPTGHRGASLYVKYPSEYWPHNKNSGPETLPPFIFYDFDYVLGKFMGVLSESFVRHDQFLNWMGG